MPLLPKCLIMPVSDMYTHILRFVSLLHLLIISIGAVQASQIQPDSLDAISAGGAAMPEVTGALVSPVFPVWLLAVPQLNGFQLAASTASLGGKSSEQTVSVSAALASNGGGMTMHLYGAFRDRKPHDHDGDAFSDITSLKSHAIGFGSILPTDGIGTFALNASTSAMDLRGGNNFHLPAHEADVAEERNRRTINGQMKWDFAMASGMLNVNASFESHVCDEYFGTEQDPSAYGTLGRTVQSLASGYTSNSYAMLGGEAVTSGGAEYVRDMLQDESEGYGRSLHEEDLRFEAKIEQSIAWEVIKASAGVTAVRHALVEPVLVLPQGAISWEEPEAFSAAASYESGYQAPVINEGDVQMEPVSGRVFITNNSPALVPEQFETIRIGLTIPLRLSSSVVALQTEAFRTETRNAFFLQQSVSADARYLSATRVNCGMATTEGITMQADGQLTPWLGMQGLATIQRSAYADPQEWAPGITIDAPFFVPGIFGEVTIRAAVWQVAVLQLSARYTGPMILPHYTPELTGNHTERSPAFLDFGIMGSFDLGGAPGIAIVIGATNLLDHYQPWLDPDAGTDDALSQGPTRPRSYFAGIRIGM